MNLSEYISACIFIGTAYTPRPADPFRIVASFGKAVSIFYRPETYPALALSGACVQSIVPTFAYT